MKKILAYGLVSAMTLSMLTGCSKPAIIDKAVGGGSKKTAKEVVKAYNEYLEDVDNNYAVEGSFSAEGKVKMSGVSVDFSLDADVEGAMANKNSHMTTSASVEALGQSQDVDVEMYVDNDEGYVYSNISTDDEWTKTAIPDEDELKDQLDEALSEISDDIDLSYQDIIDAAKNGDLFEDATIKTKGKTYIVSLTLKQLADNDLFKDIVDLYNDEYKDELLDSVPEDIYDELVDYLSDIKFVYTFDTKNCALKEVSVENLSYSGKFEDLEDVLGDGNDKLEIDFDASFSMELSDYGKVDEDDVAVPKDVKKNAVEEDIEDLEDSFGDLEEDLEDLEDDKDDKDKDDKDDEDDDEWSFEDAATLDVKVISKVSYDGKDYTLPGKVDDILKDGWKATSEEGEYSFVTYENDKYESASMYVYDKDMTGKTSEVNGKDVYGIEISTYDDEDPLLEKNFAIAGVKLGDAEENIVKVLGETNDVYKSDFSSSYYYEAEEGDNNYYLTVSCYDGKVSTLSLTIY